MTETQALSLGHRPDALRAPDGTARLMARCRVAVAGQHALLDARRSLIRARQALLTERRTLVDALMEEITRGPERRAGHAQSSGGTSSRQRTV